MVGLVTRKPGDRPTRPVGAVDGAGQVSGRIRAAAAAVEGSSAERTAERLVVAATQRVAPNDELGAVRLVARDIRRRVLRIRVRRVTRAKGPGAPDVLGPREDRVRLRRRIRVADLRPIKAHGLLAPDDRRGGDHPPLWIAVAEVRVTERARELVEPPCRIRTVIARVAAIPINVLWPVVPVVLGIVVRPSAVVLRPALD